MWPAAYSPGSLTSITLAFSRFIRRTASVGETPPLRAPLSVGHSSSAAGDEGGQDQEPDGGIGEEGHRAPFDSRSSAEARDS